MRLIPLSLPQTARLGLIGAAVLCAGSASAGSFTYQVVNNTLSGGSPAFPVTDDLTFTHLLLTETFADHYTTSVTLENFGDAAQTSLDTGALELDSDPFTLSDPSHGGLSSATLTGSFSISGQNNSNPFLDLTLQPSLNVSSQYQERVQRSFSTNLLGAPAQGGIGVGTFSLLDSSGDALFTSMINAAPLSSSGGPSPVPEASTTVSLGLMLLLGLGGLTLARRRRTAHKSE